MKNLQFKLALGLTFLMASFVANAQSNTTKIAPEKQRTEAKQNTQLTKESQSKLTPSDEERMASRYSEYMNLEKRIISWTISGKIPSSFPKYKKGQTKEEYNAIIKSWGKSNLSLIKKELRQRITGARQSSNK